MAWRLDDRGDPLSVLTIYAVVGLPSIITVNGTYPWLLTQALGLATIALGVGAAAIILDLVLQRRPFAASAVPGQQAGSRRRGHADA